MNAAAHGNVEVVKYLVAQGASVNATNMKGSSPLLLTAEQGHCTVVHYLLETGANSTHVNLLGKTLIHLAAREGNSAVMKELLSHSVPQVGASTATPVFLAAQGGHQDIVNMLLHEKPDCSPEIKCDILLLLGAHKFVSNQARVDNEFEILWARALTLRQTCSVIPEFLGPHEIYGNRVEIRTLEEFHSMKSSRIDLLYQCLIMQERIVGTMAAIKQLLSLVQQVGKMADMAAVLNQILTMAIAIMTENPCKVIAHYVFSHKGYSMCLKMLQSV